MNRGGTGFSGFLFIYREFREFETDMSVLFWKGKFRPGLSEPVTLQNIFAEYYL